MHLLTLCLAAGATHGLRWGEADCQSCAWSSHGAWLGLIVLSSKCT